MIHYYDGTVFNVETQAKVNTINCLGVMGAGIALEYKLRYPNMFKVYSEQCKLKKIKPGVVSYYNENDVIIINFPTKMHFKYPSKIEWIESGLINFVETYQEHRIKSVAFPKLGTLNGGLDWVAVKRLMEKYLSKIDADVYICMDEKKEAEGLELEMVNYYNAHKNDIIKNLSRVTEQQKSIIMNSNAISRFWHISKFDKIGVTTYSKIFELCKDAVNSNYEDQLNFFD